MPVHFEIKYSNSNIPIACDPYDASDPLEVTTSYPDWFDHDPGSGPENVESITVIFSHDDPDTYPSHVTIECLSTQACIVVVAPTGPVRPTSHVSIVNVSGLRCGIKVNCTGIDSTEDTWLFENSDCVSENGQPAPNPTPAMEKGKDSPAQLKIKVKRQPTYSCPA